MGLLVLKEATVPETEVTSAAMFIRLFKFFNF